MANPPSSLDVLVLPAFAAEDFRLPDDHGDSADPPTELDYWLDAYGFDSEIRSPVQTRRSGTPTAAWPLRPPEWERRRPRVP